ncbi:hypothetical protein ZWY2020_037545 [Hordeum vulgare]|nr:hypothetical protein ZWY2020_037545 [Hordeum vulgare]
MQPDSLNPSFKLKTRQHTIMDITQQGKFQFMLAHITLMHAHHWIPVLQEVGLRSDSTVNQGFLQPSFGQTRV